MKKKIKQPYKREINKLLKAFSRGRAKDVLDILVHMAILVPVIPITSQEMEYACSLLEDGKEEESV